MIRVERGEAPPGFATRAAGWSAQMGAKCAADPDLTASKFWSTVREEIRPDADHLAACFHQKCAYCESKATHVLPITVEHYRPKSEPAYRAHVFAWDNWLLVCTNCNTQKGAKLDCDPSGSPLLLDPTSEDPEGFVNFIETDIFPVLHDPRGKHTIDKLKLNRLQLIEARQYHLIALTEALLSYHDAPAHHRGLLLDGLRYHIQRDAPWSAMARAFFQTYDPDILSYSGPLRARDLYAQASREALLASPP